MLISVILGNSLTQKLATLSITIMWVWLKLLSNTWLPNLASFSRDIHGSNASMNISKYCRELVSQPLPHVFEVLGRQLHLVTTVTCTLEFHTIGFIITLWSASGDIMDKVRKHLCCHLLGMHIGTPLHYSKEQYHLSDHSRCMGGPHPHYNCTRYFSHCVAQKLRGEIQTMYFFNQDYTLR